MRQRNDAVGWLVAAVAIVLLGLAAWHLPAKFRSWWDEARSGHQVTRLQRQLYAARVVGVQHPEFVVTAAKAIPRTARYAILLGADAKTRLPDYRTAVPFAVYWLYPRRVVNFAAPGQWVLAFGTKESELPDGLTSRRELIPGVLVARQG